ncbi:hypothetical protein YC2023_073795 [Brassica napus]
MLSSNNITGSIPSVLSNCTRLLQLQIDANDISVLIPLEIGLLKELNIFLGWQNMLEGNIPTELAGCKNLQALDFLRTFSPEPYLLNLSFLDLSENNLSGSVPWEISNCRQLQMLTLSNNTLRGYLPLSLSTLTKLQVLDVYSNALTGKLPDGLGQLLSLNRLILGENFFTGRIPTSLDLACLPFDGLMRKQCKVEE